MPHRTPAVTTMGAIVSAWYFGARRCFVIGLDLSRPKNKPYVDGVPHSKFGASNPFGDQVLALRQLILPGMEIFNVSPHSRESLSFKSIEPCEVEEIANAAKESKIPEI